MIRFLFPTDDLYMALRKSQRWYLKGRSFLYLYVFSRISRHMTDVFGISNRWLSLGRISIRRRFFIKWKRILAVMLFQYRVSQIWHVWKGFRKLKEIEDSGFCCYSCFRFRNRAFLKIFHFGNWVSNIIDNKSIIFLLIEMVEHHFDRVFPKNAVA